VKKDNSLFALLTTEYFNPKPSWFFSSSFKYKFKCSSKGIFKAHGIKPRKLTLVKTITFHIFVLS